MTPPFGHAQAEKEAWLLAGLKDLTARHLAACPAYGAWVRAMFPGWERAERLADLPWLPVGVFKSHLLRSVPEDSVVRVLTSSGTSGQAVSRIPLDAETAKAQTRALSSIMQAVLGPKRLPMLIVDSRDAITGSGALSARGAAILGMMPFGARHAFWLDGEAEAFLAAHGGAPFLIFGMTAQVWTHLRHSGADLSHGILIHGGGWKTLAAQGVSNAQFKAELKRRTGLDRVVNFYGMAEQVGSVFLEGEDGCLHAAAAADVIIRDPQTLAEQPPGIPGLIQVVSLLPGSYPGHSILTEDWGVVESVDAGDWKGKAFTVHGRIPQAELRGCSDVTSALTVMPGPVPGNHADTPLTPLPCFDAETVDFGAALSARLFAEPQARDFADLATLAFWLRPASTALLRRHFEGLGGRQPRGNAFHIAPANVDTLFVYSWWLSVLVGNATVVRVSERGGARTELLLRLLEEMLAQPRFARLRRASAFIRYARDEETSRRLSAQTDLRVVWGGDATIAAFAAMPLKPGAAELTFPDRRSLSVMAASAYLALDEAERDDLAERFFNDCFWFDQKACSSPILLAWVGEAQQARADFWPRLEARARAYEVAPATGMAKLTEAARLVLDGVASGVTRFGASVLVAHGAARPPRPETCGGGMFQECLLESLDQAAGLLDAKLQTVTHFGFTEAEMAAIPALRLAPMGHALDFSHIWGGQDLLAAMTRAG